ncbi:MAG: ABC transporter ATP-binding protein [bacterium]|nr:MAG: ABC transporter ATP-binding protein [bacterium]
MFKILKTFYGFLLKRWLIFIGFILLVIVSNILFSLNPYFYKLFVDAIPSLNESLLFNILFIYIAVRVSAVVTDMASFWVGDIILFSSAIDARTTIFKKVQDLDFAFHANKSTGSLISAFKRGDGSFYSFFHDIHHKMLGVAISFAVMIYFFSGIDSYIVLMILASLVVTLLVTKFLITNNMNKRKAFNKEEDDVSGIITDNLINFETVKLFAKESWEENRLRGNFVPWLKTLWGFGNSFRVIDGTMGAIINISIFFVLYATIKQTVSLKLTVGDFVLITGFLGNFYPKLWDLIWGFRDLAKNYADIEKYFSILDYETEVKEPKNPVNIKSVTGNIEFKNVSHSYVGGTKNAIKKFNLKINQGESVAFVGRSGSGKTTITKLLMRFFDPERGKILIDGIDIKKFNKSDLRSFFGVVPQEPVLFNNTIGYNISYGDNSHKKYGAKLKGAAKMAHLSDFIESMPEKYKTNVGERGIKLSGGQKQRLAIARMIMSNPDIIIFDEATSHLDSESERLIQDAFWNYAKNKTTIIIAHRLSTIKKADRIIVMDKGQIVEVGKHNKLLNNQNGVYSKLWNIQKD